jgi:hypothetical protein
VVVVVKIRPCVDIGKKELKVVVMVRRSVSTYVVV